MRTLTHIRQSAARVAGLGLLMAVFGVLATTWVDQTSMRDLGCCGDDMQCSVDLTAVRIVPFVGGNLGPLVPEIEQFNPEPLPTTSETVHAQPAVVALRILAVAPKTSPPA